MHLQDSFNKPIRLATDTTNALIRESEFGSHGVCKRESGCHWMIRSSCRTVSPYCKCSRTSAYTKGYTSILNDACHYNSEHSPTCVLFEFHSQNSFSTDCVPMFEYGLMPQVSSQ